MGICTGCYWGQELSKIWEVMQHLHAHKELSVLVTITDLKIQRRAQIHDHVLISKYWRHLIFHEGCDIRVWGWRKCKAGSLASPAEAGLRTGSCVQRGNMATDTWTAPFQSTLICLVNALVWEARKICCMTRWDKDLVEIVTQTNPLSRLFRVL